MCEIGEMCDGEVSLELIVILREMQVCGVMEKGGAMLGFENTGPQRIFHRM
jgi:hypothetical protein